MTDWDSPFWRDEPLDRDRLTAERWDRLDEADARAWTHVDRMGRDLGERPGREASLSGRADESAGQSGLVRGAGALPGGDSGGTRPASVAAARPESDEKAAA